MNAQDNPDRMQIEALRMKALQTWERVVMQKDIVLSEAWDVIAQSYHDLAEQTDRTGRLQPPD